MGLLEDIDRSFRRLIREGVDNISDKEAAMNFDDLDDKDIDNDGDSDESDEYLHNKLGVVAKKVNETASDVVTFSIDDDKLDTLLHDKFSKYIDYIEDDGDSYYTLPQRQFDRFIDLADSSGFDTDELIQMNEMSTTASVPGYQTPYAFGDADEDTYGQGGMKRVKKTNRIFKPMESKSVFKKMMSEMYGVKSSTNEAVSYRDYKKDPTSTPQQKVNKGIAEVNAMLNEMERIVQNNLRLKTEMGVQSNHFWKSTGTRFAKINERMTRIANKLKELSQ